MLSPVMRCFLFFVSLQIVFMFMHIRLICYLLTDLLNFIGFGWVASDMLKVGLPYYTDKNRQHEKVTY